MTKKKTATRSKLLDEAFRIKDLQEAEMSLEDIAAEVKHTVQWVMIRCMINELPDAVRQQFFDVSRIPDLLIMEMFHVRRNRELCLSIINRFKVAKAKPAKG